MSKLNGKIAVITGGSSGIGLATAQTFIKEGAKVVITGRKQETIDEALALLGENAFGVRGDVANLADLDTLFATVKEKFGGIDVLFVNAGVAFFAPLEASSEEFFDQIMNINVKGAYFTVQKALPILHDGASVVLTTSVVNQIGMENASVYSATKAALRSLARTLSAELVGRGIRVNAVSPGPIETPIFSKTGMPQEALDEFGASVIQQVPMKRMGKADEVANAVLFLASADSSFILGSEIVVGGGMSQI
ncbi:MAG: SDR family oxidoreductase [Pyrinomonadaceae bacterium]|nr:SDR family oxidoreductase [Pyrinomonadaceae bacterium]